MGNLSNAMLKGAKAYQGQKVADRNSLVVKYAPLVKRVALHLKTRLPSYVDVNDLIQSGMIGFNGTLFKTIKMVMVPLLKHMLLFVFVVPLLMS